MCSGKDANNHMYPLPWTVVELENSDSWSWFLQILMEDLGYLDVGYGLTLITYQQNV